MKQASVSSAAHGAGKRRGWWSSNLQIETALAGLASKLIVAAIAATGDLQTSDHFIVYPATGALEIASPYRHEAAKPLESVIRSMKPSFYFDLRCLDCRELTLKISEIVLRERIDDGMPTVDLSQVPGDQHPGSHISCCLRFCRLRVQEPEHRKLVSYRQSIRYKPAEKCNQQITYL